MSSLLAAPFGLGAAEAHVDMPDVTLGVSDDGRAPISLGVVLDPRVELLFRGPGLPGRTSKFLLAASLEKDIADLPGLEQLTDEDPRRVPVDLRAVGGLVGERAALVSNGEPNVHVAPGLMRAMWRQLAASLSTDGGDGEPDWSETLDELLPKP